MKTSASMALERRNDRFLFEEYATSASSLAFIRILFSSWLLATGAGRSLSRAAHVPPSFWDPPLGPLRLIHSPPPTYFLTALAAATSVALVLLLIGYHTPLVSAVSGSLLLLGDAVKNSYGKIDHGLSLMAIFLLLMAASGWGSRLSVDVWARKRIQTVRFWPVAASMLALSVMMAMAALPKLTSEWLDPSFSAIQVRQLRGVVGYSADRYLAERASRFESAVVWEALDWVTILFESAFIFVVWKQASMKRLLAVAGSLPLLGAHDDEHHIHRISVRLRRGVRLVSTCDCNRSRAPTHSQSIQDRRRLRRGVFAAGRRPVRSPRPFCSIRPTTDRRGRCSGAVARERRSGPMALQADDVVIDRARPDEGN